MTTTTINALKDLVQRAVDEGSRLIELNGEVRKMEFGQYWEDYQRLLTTLHNELEQIVKPI